MFWARMDKTITEDPVGFFADLVTVGTFFMPLTTTGALTAAGARGLSVTGKAGTVSKTLGRVPRFASFATKMDRAFRVGGVAGHRAGKYIKQGRDFMKGPAPFAGKLANAVDPVKHPIVHGIASHFNNIPWYDALDPFLAVPNMAIGSARGLGHYAKIARTELTPTLEASLTASLGKRETAITALESYIGTMKGDRANLASKLDKTLRDIKVSHNACLLYTSPSPRDS